MATFAFPQISKEETQKFAKVWTYNGIVVALDDAAFQFATDFSNVLLRQVFSGMAQAAQLQAEQLKSEEKKVVVE
jgi:hypothetical protein